MYYLCVVLQHKERVTVVEEQIVYTFNELIADIGGGLGNEQAQNEQILLRLFLPIRIFRTVFETSGSARMNFRTCRPAPE